MKSVEISLLSQFFAHSSKVYVYLRLFVCTSSNSAVPPKDPDAQGSGSETRDLFEEQAEISQT